VACGAVWISVTNNWGPLDSILFALSALSGGGRLAIPDGSPDAHYVIVGLYVMTGIPVMAIATGVIAHAIVFTNESVDSLHEKMMVRMTETELLLMKAFGIEDGSGEIDAKEFVILTLVRIGALEPELIHYITGLYDSLTDDNSGQLTYETLQNMQQNLGSPGNSHDVRTSFLRSMSNNNDIDGSGGGAEEGSGSPDSNSGSSRRILNNDRNSFRKNSRKSQHQLVQKKLSEKAKSDKNSSNWSGHNAAETAV
jgi:hypothetical protein